jgi:hypothetical protein
MTTPFYEIVIYTVSEARKADTARAAAQELIATFPGFHTLDPIYRSGQRRRTRRSGCMAEY